MSLIQPKVEIPLVLVDTLDSGDNNVAQEHANGTSNEESLTAELVKPEDSGQSEGNLQDTSHTSSEEILLGRGESETLENLRSIVQNSVDTSELLANHGSAAQEKTLEHVGGKESLPGTQTTTSSNQLGLALLVEHDSSLDFEELGADDGVVGGKTAQLGKGSEGLLLTVLHHQPTRGEGEVEHAEEEDPGGDDLQSQRQTPGNGLLAETGVAVGNGDVEGAVGEVRVGDTFGVALVAANKLHAVVEPEGNGGTDGDGKLLQGNERSTQLGRSNLSLVKRDDHTEHTNADTTDDTTSKEVGGGLSTSLQTSTKSEDHDSNHHGVLSGDSVREDTVNQSTGPSTKLKSRHQPTLNGGAHEQGEVVLEVLHDQNRTHDTLIVTVHDTTERCETTG